MTRKCSECSSSSDSYSSCSDRSCQSCCKPCKSECRDPCKSVRCESSCRDPCNKCDSRCCQCVEYYSCIRTKCGCLTMHLTKTSSPQYFTAAGQVITYYYTITNTGSQTIRMPVRICDDKAGSLNLPCVCILPCKYQTFTKTYTVKDTDLESPTLVNSAVAYAYYKKCKVLVSNTAKCTVTYGDADVSAAMTQTLVPAEGEGTTGAHAVVTISNSALSATSAFDLVLNLPYPVGVTAGNISGLTGSATITAGSTGINISTATLAVGATNTYAFDYFPAVVDPNTSYTWNGVLETASLNTSVNTHINSTFTF